MSNHPSIYATVVFDLQKRVKEFLDQLNRDGQIDLDHSGYPYLISSTKQGKNYVSEISRNNKVETFILNPRKKAEPVTSWDVSDGFVRPAKKTTIIVGDTPTNPTGERQKITSSAVEAIIDEMLNHG